MSAGAAAPPEFRHWDFARVHRDGPSLDERVHGTASLRRWRRVGRVICAALGRVEITGLDRIPDQGPVILAVNHTSALDGVLLFGRVRRPVSFLVKAEAFEPAGGLAGRILIRAAQLPVRRHRIDPAPVRLALDLLDRGGVIGMCPEGSRGDGRVRQARPGVGYLALRSGAVVVPVAVHGAVAMTHRAHLRRPTVRVVVGAPLVLERAAPGPLNRASWLAGTEQIRHRLAELVRTTQPEPGRGPSKPKVDR